MASKSQIMYTLYNAQQFYFKGSIAQYTPEICSALGFVLAPDDAKGNPLVTQSELVRTGACVKLQVRTSDNTKPPITHSILCPVDKIEAAKTYFNGDPKPNFAGRPVLGCNIKRDKYYV